MFVNRSPDLKNNIKHKKKTAFGDYPGLTEGTIKLVTFRLSRKSNETILFLFHFFAIVSYSISATFDMPLSQTSDQIIQTHTMDVSKSLNVFFPANPISRHLLLGFEVTKLPDVFLALGKTL